MSLISVIIPAYNVEDYIARCLDSVCGQSYENLEILVIDDGSVDKTPEICDEYASRDNRIRVIHKENAGVASARNDALDMASGNMMAFADADDYYEPDMLMKLYETMTEYNADMVSCGYYEEYSDKTDEHGTNEGIVIYDIDEAYRDYFNMGGILGAGCWNKLIKANAIGEIRFKNFRMGEDVEFLCRIIDKCNKVVCIDYKGYHYIHREDSATRLGFGPMNLEILHISDEMLEFVKGKHPELEKNMYAFHAAWHSAQIQVMHWPGNNGKYTDERKFIRDNIWANLKGYIGNPLIVKMDRIYIVSYMLGVYKPVRKLYELLLHIKDRRKSMR